MLLSWFGKNNQKMLLSLARKMLLSWHRFQNSDNSIFEKREYATRLENKGLRRHVFRI